MTSFLIDLITVNIHKYLNDLKFTWGSSVSAHLSQYVIISLDIFLTLITFFKEDKIIAYNSIL